ncbi:MAG: replicative DNA helicase, partial [Spirochaetaceae bacterium]|nr:replicative DNA helicase [Spirochaetaceae bacterium]
MKHNIDAEKGVLGALLLNFVSAQLNTIDQVLYADDFYVQAHQVIDRAITELNDSGHLVDTVTLVNYLKNNN